MLPKIATNSMFYFKSDILQMSQIVIKYFGLFLYDNLLQRVFKKTNLVTLLTELFSVKRWVSVTNKF